MTQKNITEEIGTLGAALRLPYRTMVARMYAELAATGFPDIRPAHSSVFRHILPGGSRATDMAEQAQMTKQSMAYLVNYLHERGYVEFVPDPDDGRAKLVCLTERGNAVLQSLIRISRRLETEAAERMGAENLAELRRLLEQLNDSFQSQPPPLSV